MAILQILQFPAGELRQICAPVTGPSEALETIVRDMIETLESLPGCVGLAAPQVGILSRIVVVDASRYRKKVENQGRLVLVNPVVVSASGEKMGREGCLSLPAYTANVPRATAVELRCVQERFEPLTIRASDFEAVVIQHELDHLDGLLFIDRVVCPKTDLFHRKNYL